MNEIGENLLKKFKRFFLKKEKIVSGDIKNIEKLIKKEEEKAVEIIEYEETRLARWGYSFIKKIFGPIVRGMWVAEIEGLHNIPSEGPVIIASNHESYFDFICFIAASPRKIHYLAAEKFYTSKAWRPLMNITGQIKVEREAHDKSQVHKLVHSALSQGRMIGIFPEGTRSSDGKMQRAFTGVAKFALKTKTPVIPVGIIGTYEIMSRHDKFPKFSKKARIKIGKPMYFKEFHDMEHTENHFRFVTDKIMLKIGELVGKKYVYVEDIKEEVLLKNNEKRSSNF